MSDVIMVYVTAKDPAEAKTLAAGLLEQQLIACANVFPPHQAIYRWDGKVCEETEVAMILKTPCHLFDDVESYIKEHHSYSCPCIVSWGIETGHPPFLEWIQNQVQKDRE